jgi:hypothetical protein
MKKIKKYNLEDLGKDIEESDYIEIFETHNLLFISRIINSKFNGISLLINYNL